MHSTKASLDGSARLPFQLKLLRAVPSPRAHSLAKSALRHGAPVAHSSAVVRRSNRPASGGEELAPITWLTLEGEQQFKFQQLSGDFPLNHNKQKCKMFPNNNHDKGCLDQCVPNWRKNTPNTWPENMCSAGAKKQKLPGAGLHLHTPGTRDCCRLATCKLSRPADSSWPNANTGHSGPCQAPYAKAACRASCLD